MHWFEMISGLHHLILDVLKLWLEYFWALKAKMKLYMEKY